MAVFIPLLFPRGEAEVAECAVAAFCSIVLWLEKKLWQHRRRGRRMDVAATATATANVPLSILEVYNFLVSDRGGDYSGVFSPPLSLFFTCLRKFPRRERGGSHVKRRDKQRGATETLFPFQINEIYRFSAPYPFSWVEPVVEHT